MFARQRGATFLGMMTIVAIIGFALYAGIRLLPLYLEYMAVVRSLDQVASEHANDPTSPQQLLISLNRRWTVEDIQSIDPKEIEIKRSPAGFTMRAEYRAEAPFVANVSLVVDFDKSVDVKQ
ncbi:hypothetical protein HNQ60_000647 [Povalibacter uvarum]|uniref:DUF4845 domain-containing protein n=1 Tax=Povalibacter uvarum TaxID=732238 RepID=A0A841HFA9_9GAMM|nr:DUF4845 domain-containing protein [Povalibacter uvarum]MBB6091801.1 hypothetical protein [Povalibacter uvarum]